MDQCSFYFIDCVLLTENKAAIKNNFLAFPLLLLLAVGVGVTECWTTTS